MTIRDEQLQEMIGSSIDITTLRRFDAAAIARESQARSRRRRIVLGSIGLAATAATTSALVVAASESQQPTEAQPPPGGPMARPACSPPDVSIPDTAIGYGVALRTITAGETANVEAVLRPGRHLRVTRAVLVVAKPGSTAGVGDPARLPANAALRPENQLATGSPLVDVVPDGQEFGVSVRPTAPGQYPVFAVRWYIASDSCEPPAPPAGTPVESSGIAMMQLGEIVVR
jgi:hypothetical protein